MLAHIGGATLRGVPTFAKCEPAFIQRLSQRLAYAGFEAGEPIAYEGPAIRFVMRGTAGAPSATSLEASATRARLRH